MSVYDYMVRTIDGSELSLEQYKGKVLLIVNTASACGLTPHYKGLQELHEKYQEQGLVVLGFPCNQFGGQEPGTEGEIKQFCEVRFGITFPMFSKLDVKGENAHPLYNYLLDHVPDSTGEIEWNFVKFLVNRAGEPVQQFGARVEPSLLAEAIEQELAH